MVPDAATNTIYVLLARSRAGTYKVTSNNVTIASVGTAATLPSPNVHVKIACSTRAACS
ncbi:MAG: hypothetical protein ACRDLT_11305 [Solirubrobacteraceae bacterium]